ncbi:GNAT family protein [Deinococcus soli (ex Cha et al. 2016)]|uniref:RimJ/RimL family protein N-acetyltransferase n=2 Tax=Deinococcus soli (ex Cha et al. 2016) TaxID=1309411 RepID=A0AAE3XI42_9DEIO|nr:GNAT family protein [Deinococcus soli (ex Cha et al. 2016)]MDR6221446.1 RimJ/RimL family protein N-acetyltransferase [Deinococcus soli (ex Cha et al. 2016)]MDR6331425.1 RimJ/RimL family protein N-acetyltransferase [Deinococcus soli (ex Cha et al. 2016)]MDR6754584.1 RimJ/RimL family protein N-acetyltransferase [Deinococcus soli (ex Cha et al. 2016)]
MTVTSPSVQDLAAQHKLAQIGDPIRSWLPEAQLYQALLNELSEDVERVTNDEMAAEFASYCPVSGTQDPTDYKNRWGMQAGQQVLSGIRFKALDLNQPFVTVVSTERLPNSLTELTQLSDALRVSWAMFSPKYTRFFIPSYSPLFNQPLSPDFEWEKLFLAAPIQALRERPLNPDVPVELAIPADLSLYRTYVQEYAALLASNPEHQEYAQPESEEDLLYYLEEGTLYEVRINGQLAGVVAVTPSQEQGLQGFLVIEMFLYAAYRGQGYAQTVQRLLVDRLAAQDTDVLYGTIHARNTPAVQAAKRSGRQVVGGYLWLNHQSAE